MIWTPKTASAARVARAARRIATAAAVGGGGLTILGAATYGLLLVEAMVARRIVGLPHGLTGPQADGVYGAFYTDSTGGPTDVPISGPARDSADGPVGESRAEPIGMVMLGDSTAVGLGMADPEDTPAVSIARNLAAVAERPVRLRVVGQSGAASVDLDGQVDLAIEAAPDVAVIFIGANDVTTATAPAQAVRHLRKAVERLREAGVEVVVGTCPDLGTVRPLPQPLRWVTRRWSRQLAAAQTVAVIEAGGRTVAFADLLGPEFDSNPAEMFGPDRFHPSARGYLQAAYTVLPSVCAALGLWPEPKPLRGEGSQLAAMAVEEPGTEVIATRVAGRAFGPQGPWAAMVRRRTGPMPDDT